MTKVNFSFSSLLPQRKFFWIPLIIRRTNFGAQRIDKRYMGIACITAFTNIRRLGRFKGQRTQLERFCFIFSRRSCHEAFFSCPIPRGILIYLEGIVPFNQNPDNIPLGDSVCVNEENLGLIGIDCEARCPGEEGQALFEASRFLE